MDTASIKKLTASGLALAMREKRLKPSSVAEAYLADAQNAVEGVFTARDSKAALRRAEQLDKNPITSETSAVFGLPVAVADNINTADLPTACGSKMLEGFRPFYDATAVARLKKQGAVILGKTVIDEFGLSDGTTPPILSAPPGQRGICGAAEAVARNLAPLALASDSEGSMRLAAAARGLVGYKPTFGAVSRNGLISYAHAFDQIGAIARTVSDAALLAAAVIGHDKSDATSIPKFKPDFSGIENFNPAGEKIGILKEFWENEPVSAAIKKFRSLGAEIVEIALPHTEHALSAYYILSSAEASSNLAKFDGARFGFRADCADTESLYVNSRSQGFGAEAKRRMAAGAFMLSAQNREAYYQKARAARHLICGDFKSAFESCDIILAPVASAEAVWANLAGLPAVSVPCGKQITNADRNLEPAAVQLVGKKFDDAALLGFARALEKTSGEAR